MAMIRKGLSLSIMTAGAMLVASQAQASVQLAAQSGIIKQLQNNSQFNANNFGFSTCVGGSCQTLFTGVQGLRGLNDLNGFNSWANTGSYASAGGYFDNYRFTFTGVGSYFGNNTPPPPVSARFVAPTLPVPEPTTWAMMIMGFGIVGLALRRRAMAANFA
jgi:hypothetical protein